MARSTDVSVGKSLNPDKETKELFALKKIYLNSEEEGIPSTAIREIALLKELDHVNVVKLHNVIHYKQRLILVFEYCNEDLKHFITSYKDEDIPMKLIKNFMYQTFKGMAHCHQSKILHRDLKPPNILVANVSSPLRQKKIVKLADFGLARAAGLPVKNYTNEVVTLWYRSPDVLLGNTQYNSSIDIWSIGCIMAEMANKIPLLMGKNESDQLKKIFAMFGTPDEEEYPEVKELKDWNKSKFEKKDAVPIHKICPRLDQSGLDLLSVRLSLTSENNAARSEEENHRQSRLGASMVR